ncbi:MAG: PfkB family carbohydrate kinase [Paracoccaceae bacterium]|tara:strand:- start:1740 stop:2615 length:876 start_codon:yes stop_codon:yes gene_type:complete
MDKKPKILCIGSILWDIIGYSITPLARGDDKEGIISRQPGGVAMNLAVRLSRYGITPAIISALGDDTAGLELIEICKKHSIIWDDILVCPKRRTDFYMAIEDPDGVALAIADTRLLTENKRKVLNPLISGRYKNWNSPIILDSNLSSEVLEELRYNSAFKNSDFRLAPGSPSKVDRLIMFLTHSGSNIYLNLKEANYILRKTFQSSVDAALEILSYGLNSVLVTNGERMACFAQGNELIKLKPPTVKVSKLTGAGDVLMATHITKLLERSSNYDAMSFALEETSKFISEGI